MTIPCGTFIKNYLQNVRESTRAGGPGNTPYELDHINLTFVVVYGIMFSNGELTSRSFQCSLTTEYCLLNGYNQNERGISIMETITKANDYLVSGKFDISTSIKPDADSTESKTLTLRFNLNSIPLRDIIQKALSTSRISWQNGPGRSKFESWKDRSVVEVDFSSPAKRIKSREESIEELKVAFQKAGLPIEQAEQLAVKAVDNPEVINS
jgi:hypothetical protein